MTFAQLFQSKLQTALGKPVWRYEKPIGEPVPAVTFNFITENQFMVHSGDTLNRKARIQLTLAANNGTELDSLIKNTRAYLNGKTTDWKVSLPLETKLESRVDNLSQCILEFYIRYDEI